MFPYNSSNIHNTEKCLQWKLWTLIRPTLYISGSQPGVRVPPGVREDILGGT
jgi:hypothetical protein